MHSYLQKTSMITKVWLDLTETLSDELYTPTKLNMELASRLKAAEWCTICPFRPLLVENLFLITDCLFL